ncbi:MAG: glutamine amidotransferase [Eubacterium sp.]|nr:glutamine amidotransferase [Eubacterium sp.]
MRLLHLLYDFCNLYGDYGNILAMQRTLFCKDIDRISAQDMSGEIDFTQYDFIYIGSATEKNQHIALELLRPHTDALAAALEGGTIMLATGNSFEMFGKSITDSDGVTYQGLGMFDFYTKETDERIVTDQKAQFNDIQVIGFVNKCSLIYGIDSPMFTVSEGVGNNEEDKGEGIIKGNFYGTHLIGPLLIRNEKLAAYFYLQVNRKYKSKAE